MPTFAEQLGARCARPGFRGATGSTLPSERWLRRPREWVAPLEEQLGLELRAALRAVGQEADERFPELDTVGHRLKPEQVGK